MSFISFTVIPNALWYTLYYHVTFMVVHPFRACLCNYDFPLFNWGIRSRGQRNWNYKAGRDDVGLKNSASPLSGNHNHWMRIWAITGWLKTKCSLTYFHWLEKLKTSHFHWSKCRKIWRISTGSFRIQPTAMFKTNLIEINRKYL